MHIHNRFNFDHARMSVYKNVMRNHREIMSFNVKCPNAFALETVSIDHVRLHISFIKVTRQLHNSLRKLFLSFLGTQKYISAQ